MWSGPRNLSTALMRSFSSRADCVVSDEPFYASYLARTGLDHPGRADVLASQPTDWQDVAEACGAGPPPLPGAVWYQKHMSHHVTPEMAGPWLDGLDHALLIRHPARVVASYLKVWPTMTLQETGLPSQVAIVEHLARTRGIVPPRRIQYVLGFRHSEAARPRAGPVSDSHALGSVFDPLAAAGLEPATPGL